MNTVILSGYIARDPEPGEIKTDRGELTTTRFSIPVDKRKKNGEKETEWITVKAFGNTAVFTNKYITKGCKVAVTGSLEPNSYEKDGIKHHGFTVNAQTVECLIYPETKEDASQGNKESNDIASLTREDVPF